MQQQAIEQGNFRLAERIQTTFMKMQLRPFYHILLLVLGLPVTVAVFVLYMIRRKDDRSSRIYNDVYTQLRYSDYYRQLSEEFAEQIARKNQFFGTPSMPPNSKPTTVSMGIKALVNACFHRT